jgi:single-stranded-DNA-specific exonuclease
MQLKRRQITGKIFQEENDVFPLLKHIFAARGIDSKAELQCDLRQLHPVSQLLHVEKAAELIADIMQSNQKILVVGDFDADGATSTAVLVRAIKLMAYHNIDYLVPNRFEYGYGLTPEIVEAAQRFQPQLIITVDNGISSIAGVATAKAKGWQVLVTDHHLPAKILPNADVIVNPNQHGDNFPSKNLAGVGVSFYVMLALKKTLSSRGWFKQQGIAAPNLISVLDLVALGTVADVVPLDRNNRILVEQGLRNIREGRCCAGIEALFNIAAKNPRRAVASDLGFTCGPRLNAAGRLDDMSIGIECLLAENDYSALEFATTLDHYNTTRREIETEMKEQAMDFLETLDLGDEKNIPPIFCLYNQEWHQGVIGILAARIKEQFNRPVIVFADADNGEIKGSARSIQGLHIRDLLDEVASQHPKLLHKFGGHAMAAGLSLKVEHLDEFNTVIQAVVLAHCNEETFTEILYSDGELEPESFTLSVAEQLRSAVPWGQHFPEPLFDGNFTIIQKQILKEKHLRLQLKPEDALQSVAAIAFNTDVNNWPEKGQRVDLLYKFDVNEFRNQLTPQLIINKRL